MNRLSNPLKTTCPFCPRQPSARLTQRCLVARRSVGQQPDADPASAPASVLMGWGVGHDQQKEMLCGLPSVDWSRYHLQVLFIDRTDQMRARLVAGLFEKVSEWNGYGRALYPWTCGTHVDNSPAAQLAALAARAGLMAQASYLGIPPKLLARVPEQFELADLDRYDVIVAVDSEVRESVLEQVDPNYSSYYRDKVRLLSDYAQQHPLADSEVLRRGGLALLPRRMSLQLQQDLHELRQVVDIPRPSLTDSSPEAVASWNWMVLAMMLGAAGLVRYLIDAYPPDLPEYDPL